MPAKNIYHDLVVRALAADGWTITHDPLTLSYGGRDLFVDLGAERAVGQYDVYRALLAETEPGRVPYLAVPLRTYEGLLSERFGQTIVARLRLRLLIFDEACERIIQWIEPSSIE